MWLFDRKGSVPGSWLHNKRNSKAQHKGNGHVQVENHEIGVYYLEYRSKKPLQKPSYFPQIKFNSESAAFNKHRGITSTVTTPFDAIGQVPSRRRRHKSVNKAESIFWTTIGTKSLNWNNNQASVKDYKLHWIKQDNRS